MREAEDFSAGFLSLMQFGAIELAQELHPDEWRRWREQSARHAAERAARVIHFAKPYQDARGRWRDKFGRFFEMQRLLIDLNNGPHSGLTQ